MRSINTLMDSGDSGDRLVVLLNGEVVVEILNGVLFVANEEFLQINSREDSDGDEFIVHLPATNDCPTAKK